MSLTIYIKPTNFCNIDCSHCYLTSEVRSNKLSMNIDKVSEIAAFAKNLALLEGKRQISFIWHGGEPLMLKPEYYENMINVITDRLGGFPSSHSIQTSLLPFSEHWFSLIHKHFDSAIGSSIDFSSRLIRNSRDSYLTKWLVKVELARSNGIQITPSMVPTINEIKDAKQIYSWFSSNGFLSFNVDRYSNFGSDKLDRPTNLQHSNFMIGLFDSFISDILNDRKPVFINVVIAAIRGVLFEIRGERWGTTCQKDFVVVEPNGDLNTCPDRSSIEKPFSNISEGVNKFVNSDRKNWIKISVLDHKKNHCLNCEYNTWCKSGCPITPNGYSDGEDECSGYKTYLNHINNTMRQLSASDFKKVKGLIENV